jgi:hypothetical protein
MENANRSIIELMKYNILDLRISRVSNLTRERVNTFKKLLEQNESNIEDFHGHLNIMNEELGQYLNPSFKRVILQYNEKYEEFRLINIEKQNQLIRMADEYNAERLFSDVDGLSFSGVNIGSLTKSLRRTAISKRRPPSKKRN